METFLLVLAAIFPVVNPPGSALVFLSLTRHAPVEVRRVLARRVAINSFFVMAVSLLLGTFVLNLYGISVPVLRVAGGFVVAVAGWKLLNEGSQKDRDEAAEPARRADYGSMAFYPLTLPITTGPGTIAVMISLGFSRTTFATAADELRFVAIILLATLATAMTIYVCFTYADRVERLIGHAGTDIAVRLSAFILFCIGVQILWTGASELLSSLPLGTTPAPPLR
jgi:multiple antibiotic resistance protein